MCGRQFLGDDDRVGESVEVAVRARRLEDREQLALLGFGVGNHVLHEQQELGAELLAVRAEVFEVGQAKVNLTAHTITRGSRSEQLSFYELELLRLLHERVGQPVSREEILHKIWGLEAQPSNRTVDNFIVKLRKKVEKSPDKPEHILTVYGYGYKLAP